MAEKKNKSDFNAMNVAELKRYLQERGVSVTEHLKTSLVEIASAVERMGVPVMIQTSKKIKPLMLTNK